MGSRRRHFEAEYGYNTKRKVCQRCKAHTNVFKHHLVPIVEGGVDEPRNIVYLCNPCHDYVEEHGWNPMRDRIMWMLE